MLPELNEDELVKRADAADAAALENHKRTCYINTTLTLREVETAEQTFTVMGFVNALWRAPELEQEEGGATDRFSHREEGHDTVKDAMNKTISESQGRDYVSGLWATIDVELEFDHSVLSDVVRVPRQACRRSPIFHRALLVASEELHIETLMAPTRHA